jgi:hypothetical protein
MTNENTICAHLFNNKMMHGGGFQLLITRGPSVCDEFVIATIRPLKGKREARKAAKEYNATPHNF